MQLMCKNQPVCVMLGAEARDRERRVVGGPVHIGLCCPNRWSEPLKIISPSLMDIINQGTLHLWLCVWAQPSR